MVSSRGWPCLHAGFLLLASIAYQSRHGVATAAVNTSANASTSEKVEEPSTPVAPTSAPSSPVEEDFAETTLSAASSAGSSTIEVANVDGFGVGYALVIGGMETTFVEDVIVLDEGSGQLVLRYPLFNYHPAGSVVRVIKKAKTEAPTAAPTPMPPTPAPTWGPKPPTIGLDNKTNTSTTEIEFTDEDMQSEIGAAPPRTLIKKQWATVGMTLLSFLVYSSS